MSLRQQISNFLTKRTAAKYGTFMGWRDAAKYTEYENHCRKISPIAPTEDSVILQAALDFQRDGVVALQTDDIVKAGEAMSQAIRAMEKEQNPWVGNEDSNGREFNGNALETFPTLVDILKDDVQSFLTSVMGTNYKIFFLKFLKSVHDVDNAVGSQLWHSDAGPGTCINALFFPEGVSVENGAIEVLPMPVTQKLFLEEVESRQAFEKSQGKTFDSKAEIREYKTAYYDRVIQESMREHVVQPVSDKAQFIFFRNNTIHKGGFPAEGLDRLAVMFHFYPAENQPDFEHYVVNGLPKKAPYPENPAF